MKIFGIGESRTGTTSLHYFLKAASVKSIHHYEWIFEDSSSWNNAGDGSKKDVFLNFVATSGYAAFTDHPTRSFYKELLESYPDAFFINTVRDASSLERSITNYFGFDDETAARFIQNYLVVENEIKSFFSTRPDARYLEIDITRHSHAAKELKSFLNLDMDIELGRENQSQRSWNIPYIDRLSGVAKMRLGFYSIYTPPEDSGVLDIVKYLEQSCRASKSLVAESSHHFLINDASSSIRQYLGLEGPGSSKLVANANHFEELYQVCDSIGSKFHVFAVPEKYSVYPEFLPRCLSDHWLTKIQNSIGQHPSIALGDRLPFFINLVPYLVSKKGYGDLYYHGDTHTTSLGSLHLLRLINTVIMTSLSLTPYELPNNFVTPVLGSWLGDLAVQTPEDIRSYYNMCFAHNPNMPHDQSGFKNTSYIIHFPQDLPAHISNSPFPADRYHFRSPERPKQVFTNPSAPIPKKLLVFRDSTATNIIPSLAMAYQQVVSVWDRAFDVRPLIIKDEKPDYTLVITADRFICSFA
jgi:hypothetical protein